MTNTTEMPVEIFATKFTWYSEPNPSGFIEYRPTTSYTRTDTIPSKAEVAREFVDAIESKAKQIRRHPEVNAMNDDVWEASYYEARALVLKEWEDADKAVPKM